MYVANFQDYLLKRTRKNGAHLTSIPISMWCLKRLATDRLLFGSDCSVMLLSGIYVQWKSLLEKYMEKLFA